MGAIVICLCANQQDPQPKHLPMKTLKHSQTVLFMILMMISASCKKNQPPICRFVEPTDGYTVTKGEAVSVSVSAEDADGFVSEVRLYIDETGLTALDFPYQYELKTDQYASGSHTLKVTAMDNEGFKSSDEVQIILDPQTVTVSTLPVRLERYKSAILDGQVTDDGGLAVTETGFYFGTGSDPVSTGTKLPAGSGMGSFSSTRNNLVHGQTYHYVAYAVSSEGEFTGEERSFELPVIEQGSFTDPRDQEVYGTVKIGEQVWMSENLRATLYNDGSQIPYVPDSADWSVNTGPAYCWYDNDPQLSDRGALYTWYTVVTDKLCPDGWHVPSDSEWRQFEYYLGMDAAVASTDGFRGSNEGGMLKATTLWDSPNTGATDELHFSILPSGRRDLNGEFLYGSWTAFLWLSDLGSYDLPQRRHFRSDEGRISRSVTYQENGESVRCLKD